MQITVLCAIRRYEYKTVTLDIPTNHPKAATLEGTLTRALNEADDDALDWEPGDRTAPAFVSAAWIGPAEALPPLKHLPLPSAPHRTLSPRLISPRRAPASPSRLPIRPRPAGKHPLRARRIRAVPPHARIRALSHLSATENPMNRTVTHPPVQRTLLNLAISALVPSANNARTTPSPEEWHHDELVASIGSHGLFQSLLVQPAARKNRYEVIAGGRRLAALRELVKKKVLASNHEVPCIVCDERLDDIVALEHSLAENLMRLPMNPADEWQAFAKLADEGIPVDEIAFRFGCSPRRVKQRLRLGNVLPDILDAYRDGSIDGSIVRAFAATDDVDRQRTVWEDIRNDPDPTHFMVRRALAKDTLYASSPLARFVGLEAYRTAGGSTIEDLFEDTDARTEIRDPDLLHTLAHDRLTILAKDIDSLWNTVKIDPSPHPNTIGYRTLAVPNPAPRSTKRISEAFTKAESRYHEATSRLHDDPDNADLATKANEAYWTFQVAESRYNAARFTKTQHKVSVAILSINLHGDPQITDSLIDMDIDDPYWAEQAAANQAATNGITQSTNGAAAPANGAAPPAPDADAADPRKPPYTKDTRHDLRATRNAVLKAALAKNYATAFDLALYLLLNAHRSDSFARRCSTINVEITADTLARTGPLVPGAEPIFTPARELVERVAAGLNRDYLHPDDPARTFEALCALPLSDKKALFAMAVANSLVSQLSDDTYPDPVYECLARRLDPPIAKDLASLSQPVWTSKLLWDRLKRSSMLEVAQATLGDDWLNAHRHLKKAQLSEAMAHAFEPRSTQVPDVSKANLRRARAWLPEGMLPVAAPAPSNTANGNTAPAESDDDAPPADPATPPSEDDRAPGAPAASSSSLPAFLQEAATTH